MHLDCSTTNSKTKRAAEDDSTITKSLQSVPITTDSPPYVLRRHHHRRHNVAAEIWGLEIPSSPLADICAQQNTRRRSFNVYRAILQHNNLFFQFAIRLPFPSIIGLYAIDKEFHYRLNKYSVSLIHDYARYHAPLAGHIFSWVLYPHLCISDPMLRPMDQRQWLARDVPGFRWVGMILWRQSIVRSILTMLSMEGHRLPAPCEGMLMKFWGLMETNTTQLRLSFLHNKEIWTDTDIVCFHLFLIKLDMRFSDPVVGNGACQLSSLLLGQKSLSTLWKVLSGKLKLDYDETTQLVVKTYCLEELDTDSHPWLEDMDNGVDEEDWGLLAREGWRQGGAEMQHAVDMVITEGIRRELNVQQYYLGFVLYGFIDERTGQNVPVPTRLRGDKTVRLPTEGWPQKKVREKVIKHLDTRFGFYIE